MREPVHRVHMFRHITRLHMHIVPAISPPVSFWRTSVDITNTVMSCGRPNRSELGTCAENGGGRHDACTVSPRRSYGHPGKDRTLEQGRFRRFCPCLRSASYVRRPNKRGDRLTMASTRHLDSIVAPQLRYSAVGVRQECAATVADALTV